MTETICILFGLATGMVTGFAMGIDAEARRERRRTEDATKAQPQAARILEQIRHEDVAEFIRRKYGIRRQDDDQGTADVIQEQKSGDSGAEGTNPKQAQG